MKNKILKCVIVLCTLCAFPSMYAQQVNSLYFMENSPLRLRLNPAFQPTSNLYIGLPVIGYTQVGLGNNSLTVKDYAFFNKESGETVSFLYPTYGDKNKFFNSLRPTTAFYTDLQINLLSFGFSAGESSFWSFSLTERLDGGAYMPKDMFKLVLYGTENVAGDNNFNFKNLGGDMSLYTEAALGYSRVLNDQWSVGGKVKFLYGTANASLTNENLDLTASIEKWNVNGYSSVRIASPYQITSTGDGIDSLEFTEPQNTSEWFKPYGLGAGIDLGATFKPIEQLTLSAAITDLGFIRWRGGNTTKQYNYRVNYDFQGLAQFDENTDYDNITVQQLVDTLEVAFRNATEESESSDKYTTYTTAKLNIGAEYAFFDNKLSVGLLSRTMKYRTSFYEELTASVNGRPTDWFNASLSYSILNGRFSNVGAGISLRTGFVNWTVAADYIPFTYAKYTDQPDNNSAPKEYLVPYNTKGINLAVGVNLVFGNNKDTDSDGVNDRRDRCPDTPIGVVVDKYGCPIDTDGDGIPNYLDRCPNTPAGVSVDQYGCPIDTDGDGVPDYLDNCPGTPKEAFGFVDKHGCILDTDGDGVPDYLDKCPNTPKEAYDLIDEYGCPVDTDGDGVPDYLDLCPGTPKEAHGFVDKNGCILDTDGDGVPDYLDLCPNTLKEAYATVDKNGCPKDSDGDGVPDYLDKCPNTPKEAYGHVDENGCPRDTDGDGIPDYKDNCPKTPGVASNYGCPELKREIRQLFQKALQGIQFDTGKSTIKKSSHTILDQIVKVMQENPSYKLEIRGHTDSTGNPASNMTLSDNRAKSVRDYLHDKGIAPERLSYKGFGDTLPIASNKTVAGRTQNRRVEFVVSFEEVHFETVTPEEKK